MGAEFTAPAQAASTVVDDFTYSSGGLSDRYVFDQDSGNATVTTSSTVGSSDDDSNVLEIKDDASVLHAYQGDSDTDLNAYPEIGDTFSCWIRELNGTGIMNFSYGAKDANNKYYVQLNLADAHLGLFKYVNGSGQSLAGDWSNSTIENNTGWFEVEIQWTTDHTHTVTLYQNGSQVTSFSYTEGSSDPKFTANGVGFSGHLGTGETAQFDYATTEGESGGGHSTKIDDFDRGNLNPYTCDVGQKGDPGVHCTSSDSDKKSGDYALEITDEDTELISTSGLQNYPSAGDEFGSWVKVSSGSYNTNFTYGVQNHDNRYYVKFDLGNDGLYLFKYKNASGTVLASAADLGLSAGSWYYIKVNWKDDSAGTQEVTLLDNGLNEVASISGSDDEWKSGGVGFDGYLQSGEAICWEEAALVHQAELVIEETEGADVNYEIVFDEQTVSGKKLENNQDGVTNNSDGTATVTGKVNSGKDAYIFGRSTIIKSVRVWGKGNVEMEVNGHVAKYVQSDIIVEGVDRNGDGSSPTMPYSFSVALNVGSGSNLESSDSSPGDETVWGDVVSGNRDEWGGEGQFMSIHADVKKGDELFIHRENIVKSP